MFLLELNFLCRFKVHFSLDMNQNNSFNVTEVTYKIYRVHFQIKFFQPKCGVIIFENKLEPGDDSVE